MKTAHKLRQETRGAFSLELFPQGSSRNVYQKRKKTRNKCWEGTGGSTHPLVQQVEGKYEADTWSDAPRGVCCRVQRAHWDRGVGLAGPPEYRLIWCFSPLTPRTKNSVFRVFSTFFRVHRPPSEYGVLINNTFLLTFVEID